MKYIVVRKNACGVLKRSNFMTFLLTENLSHLVLRSRAVVKELPIEVALESIEDFQILLLTQAGKNCTALA